MHGDCPFISNIVLCQSRYVCFIGSVISDSQSLCFLCRSEGGGEGKAGTFFSKLKKPHFDRPDISISPSKFFKKKT